MAHSPVTGLAFALIDDTQVRTVYTGEFEGEPVTSETQWAVASLTKPVFTYGILQLLQTGRLERNTPLQSYLPEPYVDSVEYLADITAHHVMTHTSGLPNWRDEHGLQTYSVPGTKFSYSSEGLNYLQVVAEHILGTSFDVYLKNHVFLPLGMPYTNLQRETADTLPERMSFVLDRVPANGALSLRTTLEDYAKFVMAMWESRPMPLNHNWRNVMLTPQVQVGQYTNLHWGYGWGLQQNHDLSFWHWGARGLPRTMNFVVGYPQARQAVIIFTNHSEGLYVCRDILHHLLPDKPMPALDWLLPASQWRPDGFPPSL